MYLYFVRVTSIGTNVMFQRKSFFFLLLYRLEYQKNVLAHCCMGRRKTEKSSMQSSTFEPRHSKLSREVGNVYLNKLVCFLSEELIDYCETQSESCNHAAPPPPLPKMT